MENAAAPKSDRALRAREIRAIQASAAADYDVRELGADRLGARHPGMGLGTTFEASSVKVGRGHAAGSADIALSAIGCGQMLQRTTASRRTFHGNRVEYEHESSVTEWYENGPLGLEQGFTIRAVPECVRQGESLVLRLAPSALSRVLVPADGQQATLVTRDGLRIGYGALYAEDARGAAVPLALATSGTSLELRVDLAEAELPVTIDPLVTLSQAKLNANDPTASARLGDYVDLSGSTLIASAKGVDAAYVFERSGSTWSQQQKLTANPLVDFGRVAVEGDLAIVSAPVADAGVGAAYVFRRSGSTWTEEQKLTASSSGPSNFGIEVALRGSTAVVGRGGGVYDPTLHLFTRSGSTWTEGPTLPVDQNTNLCAFSALRFQDDLILAGNTLDDQGAQKTGAVYAFIRSGDAWTEQKLQASDAAAFDFFGQDIALDGNQALVGAGDADGAYYFVRSGSTFTQQKLTAAGTSGTSFGKAVALEGTTAIVGASGDGTKASGAGAVYVFRRSGSSFVEQPKITASDGAASDAFGTSVDLDQRVLAVGAPLDDDGAADSGSVYVFPLALTDGSPCDLSEECSSGHCTSEGVCCATACDNLCESCLASRKASGPDGVCGPVAGGTDPRNACIPASCPTATSEHPLDDRCDGAGACDVSPTTDCDVGYACEDDTCRTDCSEDAHCDQELGYECRDEECIVPLEDGESCTDAEQCASRFCADGVCCDTACTGQCEACAEDGNEGECVAVSGSPRGDRPACPNEDADAACEASCDGELRDACRFAPGTTRCGGSCEDGQEIVELCDGQGQCVAREPVDCLPFACGDDTCLTECAANADCSEGYVCDSGECILTEATCAEDGSASIGPGGTTPCSPYLCDEAVGMCRTSCQTSEECAPGRICNRGTSLCEAVKSTAKQDSSCSIGNARVGSRWYAGVPGLVLAALIRRRRRLLHVA